MPLARVRRAQRPVDYWPGFVDALTTMLLVITFLLSVFMLAQFFLAREVSGKDTVLSKLNKQIAELTAQLALAQMNKSDAENQVTALSATLASEQKQNAALQGEIAAAGAGTGSADARVAAAEQALKAEKDVSAQALAQVEILNQQIGALRRQLAAIEDALAASVFLATRNRRPRSPTLALRLNIALAQKVQELARYRSDFFGRLRQILGDRPDIRTVGDRFVFQSEVLFDTGKAEVSIPKAKQISTSSPTRSSSSTRKSHRKSRGFYASTGTPTNGRSNRPNSIRTGICRPPAPSPSCNIWSARAYPPTGSSRRALANFSRSIPATAMTPMPRTAASN